MSRNIPTVKWYKVTFHYKPNPIRPSNFRVAKAVEYVSAPNKRFAIWAAREQRHGCMIYDPDCERETVSLVRRKLHVPPNYMIALGLDTVKLV